MKYSTLSMYEPVKLGCCCGSTYVGQKRDSHEWIKAHGTCVNPTGDKPIRIIHVGRAAIRDYGMDDDNRVSGNALSRVDDRITRDENI